MNDRIKDEKHLVETLNRLPREIEPGNDVWRSIERRLDRAPESAATSSQRWPMRALAASVAVAFVAGLMFGRQVGVTPSQPAAQSPASLSMLAATEATEREYQAAFREFIPVGSAREVLQAETILKIEQSWADMQQTETALLAALHEYPENPFLNQKLLDLRSQQLGFMQQLATLDQVSRRRT